MHAYPMSCSVSWHKMWLSISIRLVFLVIFLNFVGGMNPRYDFDPEDYSLTPSRPKLLFSNLDHREIVKSKFYFY